MHCGNAGHKVKESSLISIYIFFSIIGYLTGSFLFAPFWGHVLKHKDILEGTKDQNPGTANAFMEGGFWCGVLTLAGDLAKGFLPVFGCIRVTTGLGIPIPAGLALVVTAPVIGHAFPVYHHFRGGKGIAVSFGSLLGLFPDLRPALTLAAFFILFSLVIRISPHYYRTIMTYVCTMLYLLLVGKNPVYKLAGCMITAVVCLRMHLSTEEREGCKVNLLWKH